MHAEATSAAESLRDIPVLIVDDNATNRGILDRMLRDWGMDPTSVASADEAIAALERRYDDGRPFRAALLDYHMPGVDGIELARMMAADPRFASTRRALLTSIGDGGALPNEAVACYLTKPVRQAVLLDCLVRMLVPNGDPASTVTDRPAAERDARPVPPATAPRVLLAEDKPVNQMVTRRIVESLGYHVDVVADGAQAVRAAQQTPYAAILMDCELPVMDGYEATALLRDSGAGRRHVPIIAVAASPMKEGDAARCYAAGMDDYLVKPVRLGEVERTLAYWVTGSTPTTGGGATAGSREEVLDLTVFDGIRRTPGVDAAVLGDLVRSFVERASNTIGLLGEALERRDLHSIQRLAHSLTGGSATLGARTLAAQSTELEQAASKAAPAEELRSIWALLSVEFTRVRESLEAQVR
jgi:CheY-like chemotaxis protein